MKPEPTVVWEGDVWRRCSLCGASDDRPVVEVDCGQNPVWYSHVEARFCEACLRGLVALLEAESVKAAPPAG